MVSPSEWVSMPSSSFEYVTSTGSVRLPCARVLIRLVAETIGFVICLAKISDTKIVIISTIPIFLVYEDYVQDKTLSIVATAISGVNLIISLALSAKDIKEVIVRKFHI